MIIPIFISLLASLCLIIIGIMFNRKQEKEKKNKKRLIISNNNQIIYYQYILSDKKSFISNQMKMLILNKIRTVLTSNTMLLEKKDLKKIKEEISNIDKRIIQLGGDEYSNRVELVEPDSSQNNKIYEKLSMILTKCLNQKEIDLDFYKQEIEKIEYIVFINLFDNKFSVCKTDEEKEKLKKEIESYFKTKKLHQNELASIKYERYMSK